MSDTPPEIPFRLGKMRLSLLAFILVGSIAGIAGLSIAYGKALQPKAVGLTGVNANYNVASIPLSDLAKAGNITLDAAGSLSVNGQLRVNGGLVLDPTTQPTTQSSTPGQLYYDHDGNLLRYFNGQVYVDVLGGPDKTTIGGLTGNFTIGSGLTLKGNQLSNTVGATPPSAPGVTSLQGQTGALTLTGGGGISITGTTITNSGAISIVSGSGTLTVTHDAGGNYTISEVGAGSSGSVALGPVLAQDDASANPSIWINKSGSGNLLQLSTGVVPVDRFVVNNSGAIITGTIGFNQVTSKPNFINSIDTATGDILLGSGLSRSGQTISASGVTSVTGTANQIIVTGSGAITLSLPQDIALSSSPSFAGLTLTAPLTVASGGTGLSTAPTSGQLLIGNGAGYTLNTLTAGSGVQVVNAAGSITISAPNAGSCGTCANTALSNLASVALNTSLLPASAGAINLGSGVLPFGQLSLSGTSGTPATNNFLITGTSTGGTRTITLPNASGTVAVSASGYLSLNAATGALTFVGPLAVADGGTGTTTAGGARTNLGAAASGANSDITSITGLTTALTVAQGGSGAVSLNQDGVLLGNGTSPISALVAGSAGQCLVSTAGAPTFQACPGSGGVNSVNSGTGAVTIAGVTGTSVSTAGNAITINDATTAIKGLASFNSTNFSVVGGAVNTIQGIATSATPTFAGLNLTAALSVGNGGTGSTTAGGARTNLGAAASGANADITSLTGVTSIGLTTQSLALQGSDTTTLTATAAGKTTTIGFATPGANVTYLFQSATAGTYDVCTTAGNCSGVGGGVTSPGGTAGNIAKFSAGQTIVDSLLSESGGTVTVGGILAVNTLTPTAALTLGATTQNLTLQGAVTTLTSTSSGVTNTLAFTTPSGGAKTITLPNASGTVAVSAAGPLSLDAAGNLTCATCLTSGGGGGSAGVSSLDTMTGALLIQGTANQVVVTDNTGSNTVVLSLPQSIATSSTPTFAGLSLTAALTVGNGGTGITTTPTNGQLLVGNGTNYTVASLGATGLTVTPGAGTLSLAVNYGSGANNAAAGANTFTCNSGSGQLSGGGGTVTLGTSGTNCGAITISTTPSFSTITSTVSTGTAPLTVTSSTKVTNLNADLLDGLDSTAFAAASGSANYIQNGTTVQTSGNYYIRSAAIGSVGGIIEGANGQTADLLRLNTFNGTTSTTVASFSAAGVLSLPTNGLNVGSGQLQVTGGNVSASGTINGATISGGTISGGNVSGGTLTAAAVNGLNVSATAIGVVAAATNLTIDAGTSGTVSIGATSTGDILLGGGSGSTGCTVTNASGNLACTGSLTLGGVNSLSNAGIIQNAAFDPALSYTNLQKVGALSVGSLAAGFTTVAVGQGGTGATSFTANGVLYGNTTGAVGVTAAGTTGQCFTGNTGSAPTWATCPAGTGALIQAPAATATNTISPTGATTGLTVNGSATATLAVNVLQAQAADGVNIAMSAAGTNTNGLLVSRAASGTTTNALNVTNATGTTTNGLAITNSSGTTTTGINLTQSGGTFTTGIGFTGTYTNLISAPNFSVSNAGIITTAALGAATSPVAICQNASNQISSCGVNSAGVTLQNSYDATSGNTISTSNAKDLAITLADTATDSNLTVTSAAGSSGFTTFSLADGANASPAAQLVLVKNNDVNQVVSAGISVQSAAGGLTSAFAASGTAIATAFDASGAGITNALSIGAHAIAGTNFNVSATGAVIGVGVDSGTGLLQGIGGLTLNKTLTVNSGGTQNVESITFASPADSSGTNVSQGLNITPTIGNSTAGTNTANIINIGAVTGDAQVTLNGLNIGALTGTSAAETAILIGAGWDNVLTVGGTPIINGSGVVQSAGISGAYTNLTGTGALTSGSLAAGFTAVAATLGGTGQSSYAVGDLLYASTTTALSKLADVGTGSCLISGGVGVAPSWGSCTGGGGGGATTALDNLASVAINTDLSFATGGNRALNVAAQTSSNTAGNNLTVTAATGNGTGAGGTLALQGGTGGSGATGNGGALTLFAGNSASTNGNGGDITISAGTKTGSGTSGSVIVKPQASNDSTTVFQVQNAVGTRVLNADTTTPNLVTNSSFEQNTSGWAAKGVASLSQINTQNLYGDNSMQIAATTTGDGAKYNLTLSAGVTYIMSFYAFTDSTTSNMTFGYACDGADESSAVCSGTSSSGNSVSSSGGWIRFSKTFTPSAISGTPYFFIKQTVTSTRNIWIDGVDIEPSPNSNVMPYRDGSFKFNGVITSPVSIMPTADSTDAFQVMDSNGNRVFVMDTRSNRVAIGSTTVATARLYDYVNSSTAVGLRVNQDGSANALEVQKAAVNMFTVSSNVNIGIATTDSTQVNLQLDSYSTFADSGTCDATTTQGSMYYNTKSNSVRICHDSVWSDVMTTKDTGLIMFGVVPDSGATNPGDLAGIVATGSGPCRVYMGNATNKISWTSCTAYSGGRRVVVAAGSNTATSANTANNWAHLCLNGANNQPSLTAVNASETSTLPTWSATAPILCLADIKNNAGGTAIGAIYDTRTYTTTVKQIVNVVTTAPSLGMMVKIAGADGQYTPTTAANDQIQGVIIASANTTTANTMNAIIATGGPASIKAVTTGTFNQYVIASATGGYTTTNATVSATAYGNAGIALTSINATCSANNDDCRGSVLVNFQPR